MYYHLPLVVLLFFFGYGLGTVVWNIRAHRYWTVGRNVGYVLSTAGLHSLAGTGSAVLAVGYVLAPGPITSAVLIGSLVLTLTGLGFRKLRVTFGTGSKLRSAPLFLGVCSLTVAPFAVGIALDIPLLVWLWPLAAIPFSTLMQGDLEPANQNDERYQEPQTKGDVQGKNVIFCVIDDVRRDRMSLYGYERETTPFLESKRSDAYVFENCLSPSTRSGHSIPSLLSGAPASVHRFGSAVDRIQLLTDEFRAAGYATGFVSGNPHLRGSTYGEQSDWFCYVMRGRKYAFRMQRALSRLKHWLGRDVIPVHFWAPEIDFLNDLAEGFIKEQLERDRPFFLYLSYLDVHEPYLREFAAVKEFAGEHGKSLELGDWVGNVDFDASRAKWYDDEPKEWGYDEAVRYSDRGLSELYDMLEAQGVREETVVVITSDHGELLGERGIWGHIDVPYNPLVEVPLVVDDPDTDGGETVESLVSGLQVPSLIMDLADVEPSADMADQWVTTLVRSDLAEAGPTDEPILVDFHHDRIDTKGYAHPHAEADTDGAVPGLRIQRLLATDSWKLLALNDRRLFFEYDDAFLEKPAAERIPDTAATRLEERLVELAGELEVPEDADGDFYEEIEDEQVRRHLEALGYL